MDVNWLRIGFVVLLVLTFLYAVLIAGQPLLWFSFLPLLIAVYLLYLAARLVRAVETIAENSKRPETDDEDR